MHPRAEEFAGRVREAFGIEIEVREFPEGTKTAEDAAEAIECEVERIASSLVFVADGDPVVVVASGAHRVDEGRLADELGVEEVRTADPEEVQTATGWSIGGVPPFAHEGDLPVYLDRTLTGFDRVWAAAGTPEAVFPVAPDRIREVADATVVDVSG